MIKIAKPSTVAFIGALAFVHPANAQLPNINATPRIVIPAPAKRPSPNGFDLYVRAAKSIIPAKPTVDEVNDGKAPTDPKVRARQYSLRRKKRWLRQNARAFALFQSAMKVPTVHPPVRDIDDISLDYAALREMARVKKIEANTRRMSGDWNGAMQSRLDTAQMGTDIARGGFVASGLVANAIQSIARNSPWEDIEHLRASQARAAASRLEAIYNRRLLFDDALREEKWFSLTQMLSSMREPQWRDIRNWTDEKVSLATRARALTVSKQTVVDNTSRAFDRAITNARLPLLKQKPLPAAGDPFSDALVSPNFSKSSTAFARNDAGNALWLVALALRAHKLERGSYPTSIRVLVPRYLKTIPADPFGGGEALRYKRVGRSYLLWSVGPDGIDNNGVAVKHSARELSQPRSRVQLPIVTFGSKGDYVAGRNR